jgi:hypothetical protein
MARMDQLENVGQPDPGAYVQSGQYRGQVGLVLVAGVFGLDDQDALRDQIRDAVGGGPNRRSPPTADPAGSHTHT